MKHYWVLGLLGVGFYGVFQYSQGQLWFQTPRAAEQIVVNADPGDFHWNGRVDAGKVIEIKGVNGSVVAHAGQGDQVVVTAAKRSRRNEVKTVRIEVLQHSDGVTICAVYPSNRSKNQCAPGDGGRLGSDNNDVNVDFEVQVPPGVTFVGKTVNGRVQATGLRGPLKAETVNGGIEVSASGAMSAETVNGSIDASLNGELTGDVRLQTVNGRLRLALPEGTNAHIEGATANGQIQTEFPLTVQGRFGPKRFDGMLGKGGESIRLESVNGSISVLKQRAQTDASR